MARRRTATDRRAMDSVGSRLSSANKVLYFVATELELVPEYEGRLRGEGRQSG